MKKGLRLLCAFFNVYFVEYCVVIIVSDTFKGPKHDQNPFNLIIINQLDKPILSFLDNLVFK